MAECPEADHQYLVDERRNFLVLQLPQLIDRLLNKED